MVCAAIKGVKRDVAMVQCACTGPHVGTSPYTFARAPECFLERSHRAGGCIVRIDKAIASWLRSQIVQAVAHQIFSKALLQVGGVVPICDESPYHTVMTLLHATCMYYISQQQILACSHAKSAVHL